jgi:hypothetical protein
MAKDSYWFKHDSTAGRGLRMRKMAHIYNHWGKGVYWDVLEVLRDQNGYKFERDNTSLQMLCDLIGCKDEGKFLEWFDECLKLGLFEVEGNVFYCPILSENMQNWEIKKLNGSKGGRPKKSEIKPNLEPNLNLNKTIREEKIIEEKKKEDDSISGGNDFDFYATEIAKPENSIWVDNVYMKLKLKRGSLGTLLKDFKNHLGIKEQSHRTLKDFKDHFYNWLNTQERIGKLKQHDTSRPKIAL